MSQSVRPSSIFIYIYTIQSNVTPALVVSSNNIKTAITMTHAIYSSILRILIHLFLPHSSPIKHSILVNIIRAEHSAENIHGMSNEGTTAKTIPDLTSN